MKRLAALVLVFSTPVVGASTDDAVIEDYVESFAQANPEVGQALAEPESPAWWMAMYRSLSTATVRDAGLEPDLQIETVADGSVEVCYQRATLPCVDYDRFTLNSDGLIVSFYEDDHDITPRLGGTSEPVAVGTAAFARVFVSYRTVRSDSLVVVVSVSATDTTNFGSASYVNPNGRQVDMSDSVGPRDQVFGGAFATFLLTFPSSDPGGRLIWSAQADGERIEIEIPVPTLAPPADAAPPTTVA